MAEPEEPAAPEAAAADAEAPAPFGFVVDDDGPDKAALGGASFALALADQDPDPGHQARCPSCTLLDEPYGCVGLVPAPLSADAERWLVERLPEDIEGLPGFLLRKAIAEYGYTGELAGRLRQTGILAPRGGYTRHYGPFFRRFTVSTDQVIEELFCAGDVEPAHALAVLVHLGLLTVDGKAPASMDDGPLLGEVVGEVPARRARTACTVTLEEGDDPSLVGLKRYLRALWAGFVLDATVRVFGPELPG